MKFRISIFSRRLPKIPSEIMLEITDRCNLNCRFCFNKLDISQKKGLCTDSVKKIIDKIKKAKVPIVRFTGGEPLLRDDIFELMDYAYQKGLKVWLNTNATLITRQIAKKIASYVENVLIPLNAYNSETEKAITGQNFFKRKLKGIALLKEYGVRYIRCGTVATRANIINLERIYNLVKRLDVSDWELFRVIPLSKHEIPLTNEDIAVLVEKLLKINKQVNKNYKIANAIPFCSYEPEKVKEVSLGGFADDGHNRFVINSIGRAKPMYYLIEDIGDIFHDDILTIWNNNFMKEMRMLHIVADVCKRCKYIEICKGGSRIVSKTIRGTYNELDYLAQPQKYEYIFR